MDIVDQFINYLNENTLTREQSERIFQALQENHSHFARDLQLCTKEEEVKSITQGHLYAYRIPFINVVVNRNNGGSTEPWCLVKVGRADPDNCYQRLGGESAIFCGERQHLDPKPRVYIPHREGVRLTDAAFEEVVYDNWVIHEDLLFVVACNIGREREYRCWPSGMGVDVGTGRLSHLPEKLHVDCRYSNLRIKTTALRTWILGMSLTEDSYRKAPTESLGESEWVVLPTRVFDRAREQHIRSEKALQELIAFSNSIISEQAIFEVELTLLQREVHPTLSFSSSNNRWPTRS